MTRTRGRSRGNRRSGTAASTPAVLPAEATGGWLAGLRAQLASGPAGGLNRRVLEVLVLASVSLTLYHYYGERASYYQYVEPWMTGRVGQTAVEYRELLAWWYRSLASIVFRIALPLAWIAWVFRESPREFGFRRPEGNTAPYYYLYFGMLPLLVAASFLPSFQAAYPLYRLAGESWQHFVLSQTAYGIRFAAVEAFFRGFLLFALYRRFGWDAIVILAVPYCLIHFGKPMGEALGSIGAGLALGYLALRSKSWVPGALLHWAVAISMDLLGIAQSLR